MLIGSRFRNAQEGGSFRLSPLSALLFGCFSALCVRLLLFFFRTGAGHWAVLLAFAFPELQWFDRSDLAGGPETTATLFPLGVAGMSQPQMQHRPTMINGVSRRRVDRDLGSHPESFRPDIQNDRTFQPTRPFTNNLGTESSGRAGHQHLYNPDSDNIGYVGSSRPSAERGEGFPQGVSRGGEHDRLLNERLLFMTACLVGQSVEVQMKNGSIYSGIFHTANVENDYGVVLKMARLTKDVSVKGGKTEVVKDLSRRAHVKTFIIPPKDLVQIIAKDVPISGELLQNGRARENRAEIITDSFLSQGRLGELERQLKPWTPDKDDPKDPGLESTFQSPWNRNWDQFETNKALFGYESTFDEEIYTTRLDRAGPQSKELERKASRIAREIEGQSTKNPHLAEERGVRMTKELDDESRYSSVLRMNESEENDGLSIDLHNDESIGNSLEDIDSGLIGSTEIDLGVQKMGDPEFRLSGPSSGDLHEAGGSPYQSPIGRSSSLVSPLIVDTTSIQALNLDPGCPQVTKKDYREFNEFKQQENARRGKKQREDQVNELKSFSESLKDFTKNLEPRSPKLSSKNVSTEDGGRPLAVIDSKSVLGSVALTINGNGVTPGACTLPASGLPIPPNSTCSMNTISNSDTMISTPGQSQPSPSSIAYDSARLLTNSSSELMSISPVNQLELPCTSGAQPSLVSNIETPISPMHSAASTTAPSSPSSLSGISGGAASSKKSSLNPNAKEFKLNPNAKSFTPNFTPVRPPSPVVQGPLYVPGGMPPVAQMQPMPVGVNPLLQQPGQPASKFTSYNSMPLAAASTATPFVQPPGTYAPGVSGAGVPPSLPGQTALKIPPQVQQPVVGQSFGSQPPIRFTSQAAPVQAAQTYLHPNMQLYSQQMMFGQPGQFVYIQPFPQGPPMPPPQPAAQAASQQNQQPKHRGGGVQGVPFCIAPPFFGGQQHFLQQVQLPHVHNPSPGVLAPTTMPGIQPSQSVMAGMVPTIQNAGNIPGTNAMRVGGKVTGGNFQQ